MAILGVPNVLDLFYSKKLNLKLPQEEGFEYMD